jgi:hypothetical protein
LSEQHLIRRCSIAPASQAPALVKRSGGGAQLALDPCDHTWGGPFVIISFDGR